MLLSINIPTYERIESFCQIVLELEEELINLPQFSNDIEINIIDNNSTSNLEKKSFCESVRARSGIRMNFHTNSLNIGGDENIYKCCTLENGSIFTWVLGDDDHITKGSLFSIVNLLVSNLDTTGLLILRDSSYNLDDSIKNKRYSNYLFFSKYVANIQPHYLIAHTLISCNIFRTTLFDSFESNYVNKDLTPRLGLKANFSHMRGIVKGLLNNTGSKFNVLTLDFVALDTSRRLPSSVSFENDILKIYEYYFFWLISEAGIQLFDIKKDDPGIDWLFN
jgi:hypothetical protein